VKAPYWLDADVLIQAKNSYYAFDIVPSFWGALQQGVNDGLVLSPMMVHDELMRGGDELTNWAKGMKGSGLFQDADKKVQAFVGKIADYVGKNFEAPKAKLFLEGADPWVISSAHISGGTVVTHESLGGIGCKRVKIPNVCDKFGVPYTSCFQMLRGIKAIL
jgi:hypothetical protein